VLMLIPQVTSVIVRVDGVIGAIVSYYSERLVKERGRLEPEDPGTKKLVL